jgi:putative ABC transport system ATP-binding protein
VADEPTGNLDSATACEILSLFERLVVKGKTVVMVTHDAAVAEKFTRVFTIADGRLTSGLVAADMVTLS